MASFFLSGIMKAGEGKLMKMRMVLKVALLENQFFFIKKLMVDNLKSSKIDRN